MWYVCALANDRLQLEASTVSVLTACKARGGGGGWAAAPGTGPGTAGGRLPGRRCRTRLPALSASAPVSLRLPALRTLGTRSWPLRCCGPGAALASRSGVGGTPPPPPPPPALSALLPFCRRLKSERDTMRRSATFHSLTVLSLVVSSRCEAPPRAHRTRLIFSSISRDLR